MRVPHTIDKNTLKVYERLVRQTPFSSSDEESDDDYYEDIVEEEHTKDQISEVLDKETDQEALNEEKEVEEQDEDVSDILEAGNKYWDLDHITTLSELCIKVIAMNFAKLKHLPIQETITAEDWVILLEELPLDLPLNISVPLIPESYYWERACNERWKKFSCSEQDDCCWKQMYLEEHCQQFIETLDPTVISEESVGILSDTCASYIRKLKINQLLIEKNYISESSNVSIASGFSGSEGFLDLSVILPRFPLLQELQITYGVKKCGLDFEWCKFELSKEDIWSLSHCILSLPRLKIFKIHRSKLTDAMAHDLWDSLLSHQFLEELTISHCEISDASAIDIARLISMENNLKILNLVNNKIGSTGAAAIASALLHPKCSLELLNLKLNAIEDSGGREIAKSLETNKTLKELNLAACSLNGKTFTQLGESLKFNKTLKNLDVSNNDIDEQSTTHFVAGIKSNKIITAVDVRMTNIDSGSEVIINELLDRNRGMRTKSINSFYDDVKKVMTLFENDSS